MGGGERQACGEKPGSDQPTPAAKSEAVVPVPPHVNLRRGNLEFILSDRRGIFHPRRSGQRVYRNEEGTRLVGEQILQRITGQSAKSHSRFPVSPSPHHASRSEASEKLRPEQPVESRKESDEQPVLEPVPSSRIGTVERKRSGLPPDPRHRTPHRPLGLPLRHNHGSPHGLVGGSQPDHAFRDHTTGGTHFRFRRIVTRPWRGSHAGIGRSSSRQSRKPVAAKFVPEWLIERRLELGLKLFCLKFFCVELGLAPASRAVSAAPQKCPNHKGVWSRSSRAMQQWDGCGRSTDTVGFLRGRERS
jgi:hypothetical protein